VKPGPVDDLPACCALPAVVFHLSCCTVMSIYTLRNLLIRSKSVSMTHVLFAPRPILSSQQPVLNHEHERSGSHQEVEDDGRWASWVGRSRRVGTYSASTVRYQGDFESSGSRNNGDMMNFGYQPHGVAIASSLPSPTEVVVDLLRLSRGMVLLKVVISRMPWFLSTLPRLTKCVLYMCK